MSKSWVEADSAGEDQEWAAKFTALIKSLLPKIEGKSQLESAKALQEIIRNTSAPLKTTDVRDRPERFFLAHRIIASLVAPDTAPGFWIRFTVHYNLCFGTVMQLGSEEQVQQLDEIARNENLGAFLLTEYRAGVNSGLVVETIADYDAATQEFVITTGSGAVGDPAEKNWISSGLMATHGCVVADLRLNGKSYGAHGFLCKMRDSPGSAPLAGITMKDMGAKTIGDDLDNARIGFNKVRVPKSTLLSRYGDIDAKGNYIQKAKGIRNFQMIGQRLFSGRIAVGGTALCASAKLLKMTKNYAESKVCWSPQGSRKLAELPQVKALFNEGEALLERLEKFVRKIELDLCAVLRGKMGVPSIELQIAIATCKIQCAERMIDLLNRLKMDIGSYGLMSDSLLNQIDFLQACKFAEGDSRILSQKMSRDLVTAKMSGRTPDGMVVQAGAAGCTPAVIAREERVLNELIGSLKKAGADKDKKVFMEEWDRQWRKVYELADCIQQRVICNWIGPEPEMAKL